MEATLLMGDNSSVFRHDPSPEVDLAWKKIGDTRPIAMQEETLVAIGKDPNSAVQIPEDWGLGDGLYFGRLDVFHQIHCLNALRMEAHFEYYYGSRYPGGYNDTTEFHRLHLSHCIHLLLQNIMCNANTDVYSHFWTDTFQHPFPDFNIPHQCKNFDSILSWQRKNALDEERFVGLQKPDQYPYSVMNHRFKEVHGWFRDHADDADYLSGRIG